MRNDKGPITSYNITVFSKMANLPPSVNPTPNSLLFKWNARKHYACPSTHNDFAGYNVRHLMLDTGCSSILLPISSDEDMDQLLSLFGDMSMYTWTIGVAGNAGPVSSCTLAIKRIDDADFDVRLCHTTSEYRTTLPMLRFSVSYIDGKHLIALNDAGALNLICIANLKGYINVIDQILQVMPNLAIGARRDYALIGQSLLKGKYMFQCGMLAMVCQSQAQVPPQIQHPNYINVCHNWIQTEFNNMAEFDFIDDDGNIQELDDLLVAVDE